MLSYHVNLLKLNQHCLLGSIFFQCTWSWNVVLYIFFCFFLVWILFSQQSIISNCGCKKFVRILILGIRLRSTRVGFIRCYYKNYEVAVYGFWLVWLNRYIYRSIKESNGLWYSFLSIVLHHSYIVKYSKTMATKVNLQSHHSG